MKNKRGFTLIELLAVIVILAIIALVAIPIVLNIVNSARKKAAESSAYGFIDAIEYNNGLAGVMPDNYTMIEDGEYDLTDPLFLTLKMKGKKPERGEIKIENRGVTSGCLQINGYRINIEAGKVKKINKGICYEPVTIHFDANGGSNVENQEKNLDKKIGVLPTSEKDRYALIGWFTEKDGGTQINEDTIVTGETTYYAHWQKNAFSVTFVSQGGSAVNSMVVTKGNSIGTLPTSTKTGYTLNGWYTEENGGTKIDETEVINDDITYYAHWNINQYNLKVNSSVNGNKSTTGHNGFTFDVYVNNALVANDVITYNSKINYNTPVKVILNEKTNYTVIDGTIEETVTSDTELVPAWITSSNIGTQFKYGNLTLIVITEGKTWENAEAYAQSLGGHLAMIKTQEMQNYVYNTILANPTVAQLSTFWIGATDKANEGDWRWIDGTKLSSTYSNWNSGEPNDSSGEDYCQYYISGSTKGKWNDLNGTQVYPFVVQIGG